MSDKKPIEVNLSTENEVYIGGESFAVRIKSSASLGKVVSHAENLYRLRPQEGPRTSAGFGLPVSEGRYQPDAPGTSMPYVDPVTVRLSGESE